MCGLAGMVHRNGAPASGVVAQRMGEAVRHRGPDGSGLYILSRAA